MYIALALSPPGSIKAAGSKNATTTNVAGGGKMRKFIILNAPKRWAETCSIAEMWCQAKNMPFTTKNINILYENEHKI
jgi:hypothetical protein